MGQKLNILAWLQNQVDATGAQYLAFGIFGLINYPGSYFFWHSVIRQEYNPLSFRLIAAILCIPLIFYRQWPRKLKLYLPLYWYLTILYCLPFFGTYMLLMNHLSNEWLMNMVLGLFLFILLVDWLMFIILLCIGIILSWGLFVITSDETLVFSNSNLQLACYMYLFAIVIGIVFSRNKEKLAEEKTSAAKLLAATVAHELRTPLGSIKGAASGIKNYLPTLLKGYEIAEKTQDPDLPLIRPSQIEILKKSLTSIEKETVASNLIINMLLTNLSANQLDLQEFSTLSMNQCVTNALERYPVPDDMRAKIHWVPREDFLFKGSELLTEHVLFNLLKNSLYSLKAADKGEIFISLDTQAEKNIVLFKDTGTGIDPEDLPNIFKPFYSKTRHGTGVGLAFCKSVMKLYGGDITCRSEKNSYAEFILSFPKGVEK